MKIFQVTTRDPVTKMCTTEGVIPGMDHPSIKGVGLTPDESLEKMIQAAKEYIKSQKSGKLNE